MGRWMTKSKFGETEFYRRGYRAAADPADNLAIMIVTEFCDGLFPRGRLHFELTDEWLPAGVFGAELLPYGSKSEQRKAAREWKAGYLAWCDERADDCARTRRMAHATLPKGTPGRGR